MCPIFGPAWCTKVSPAPQKTSVSALPAAAPSLRRRCPSCRCLCLSVPLTPVASRSVAPNSRQRPQTGWLQITFSSKEEKCVRREKRGANPPSVTKTLEATLVFIRSLKPLAAGQPDLIKTPENTALQLQHGAFGVQFS